MEKEISYTDEWTRDQIAVAKLTERKAFAFSWLHHHSYKYYENCNKIVHVISTCMVTLISGLIILLSNLLDINLVSSIGNGIMIFASIIILIIQIGWDPSSISTEHFASATENKKLHASLTSDFSELITHDQIQTMIKNKLKLELHMRDNAPQIPKCIWKKYYKTFGAKAIKFKTLNNYLDIDPVTKNSKHVQIKPREIIVRISKDEDELNQVSHDGPSSLDVEKIIEGAQNNTKRYDNNQNDNGHEITNAIAKDFIERLKQGAERRKHEREQEDDKIDVLFNQSIHRSNEDIDIQLELKNVDDNPEILSSPKKIRPTMMQQYEMERYLAQTDPY